MGKMQRTKGRRAQTEFKRMLTERDWGVIEPAGGMAVEDVIATSPQGVTYSVEVKHHEAIRLADFIKQAKEQAKKRKLPWMLAVRLPQLPGQ